ncbi:Uncharacterized protein SCF082_LOCUS4207 [Durusdinium trenchii]|uniref:Uncharacterized protein n=1 Tax=Durusdinium trenchii TaxID=1381693 RepID=A0ABP0HXY2_9DINO
MNDFAARGRCPALPPLCRPSGRRLARWSSPRALGGLALLCLAASAASTATSARGGATTFSLHEGLEIREVDFSKGAGAGAGAWPAPLAAFLGFSLAALIMVPAVVAGPTVAMPPAFGVLFYQLAMLAGQSWFPCIVSATVGVPFAHGLLLVPSITFQYALPALVAPAAGLCAARYLGGVWAQHLCLLLLGLLLLFHGFCMLRVIKIGRWQ